MARFAASVQNFTPGEALQNGTKLNKNFGAPQSNSVWNETAAGTTQATATPVTSGLTQFSTVAANSGAILTCGSVREAPQIQDIYNDGANPLTVYPPVGMQIDGNAVNAGVTLTNGNRCRFTFFPTGGVGVIKSALLGAVSA